ncbi:MAG TPA: hypothetical protein VEU51_03195 [Candidatus Acidoferrales bacterium]|nr:hypothetical protein [Candidatus Acidoferrales bacterium]
MSGLIEQAKDRGEIASEVESALLSHNLFALYYAFMVLWLGSGVPSPENQRPTLRQALELQLKGLTDSLPPRHRRRMRR